MYTSAQKFEHLYKSKDAVWMGIVNLTPDSFSDGAQYNSVEKAVQRSKELIAAGADILDFGGVSTRPRSIYHNVTPVSLDEELKRVLQIMRTVRKVTEGKTLLSIDTYSPGVAQALAEEQLVDIINDVHAGRIEHKNLNTAKVAANFQLGYIVMHMPGTLENLSSEHVYINCLEDVFRFLQERIQFAIAHGVTAIAVDPGIGFGKNLQENLLLLEKHSIQRFISLGIPLLIGLSRKNFLQKIYPDLIEPTSRDKVTKEFEWTCLQHGAKIIRSHCMPQEII